MRIKKRMKTYPVCLSWLWLLESDNCVAGVQHHKMAAASSGHLCPPWRCSQAPSPHRCHPGHNDGQPGSLSPQCSPGHTEGQPGSLSPQCGPSSLSTSPPRGEAPLRAALSRDRPLRAATRSSPSADPTDSQAASLHTRPAPGLPHATESSPAIQLLLRPKLR